MVCRQATKASKRRRLELKALRRGDTLATEVREGPTYQSNIGLSAAPDGLSMTIPPTQTPPKPDQLPVDDYMYIMFDLETTDRGKWTRYAQIMNTAENKTW